MPLFWFSISNIYFAVALRRELHIDNGDLVEAFYFVNLKCFKFIYFLCVIYLPLKEF